MEELKKCNKCGIELPKTPEYFYRNKNIKDGFTGTCKKCSGGKYMIRIKDTKVGFKICGKCNKELPATKEYFSTNKRNPSGLYSLCKECKSKQDKKYREKNKDKKAKTDRIYYEENKEKIAEYKKEYHKIHFKKIQKKSKQYYKENKEQIIAKNKIYESKNMDKVRNWKKNWVKNNPEKVAISVQKRIADKRNVKNALTPEQWKQCLEFFNYKDAYTGLDMKIISQDHVIPLNKNGPYTRENIVPCEINVNCSKQDSDMEEWYRKQDYFSEERLAKIYNWINLDEKEETQVS